MLRTTISRFFVSRDTDARLWRLSLPYSIVFVLGIFGLVVLVSAGIGTYHYGKMAVKVADYDHLLDQNDTFRAENHNYRIQTAQLGEKIDFLETTSRKLMIISGMDSPNGLGGVGGFSRESLNKPVAPSAGTLHSIDSYNKSVSQLEDRYHGLAAVMSERALLAAATPSLFPVRGYVTGGMGLRHDPFNGSRTDFHTGIDISAPYGSRVIAPADGTVIFAGQRDGYGNIVVIDHKFGLTSRYGHLWKFNVQVGQHLSRHDLIGYVGSSGRSTGPHLHFELWLHSRAVNPMKFIRAAARLSGAAD